MGQPSLRVLVVASDDSLRETAERCLTRAGYDVAVGRDGIDALRMVREHQPDLLLLASALPGLPGMDVLRFVRRESSVPIVLLSEHPAEEGPAGLEMGADDCLGLPFSSRDLLARLGAVLRRSGTWSPQPDRCERGGFSLDQVARQVRLDGQEVPLQPRELDLLSFLVANPGQVHGCDDILRKVWGDHRPIDRQTLYVHVRWLREKFRDPAPFRIVTVRGSGYRLDWLPFPAPASPAITEHPWKPATDSPV